MEKLNTALQLAEAGLHVFPLTPGAKNPLGALAPHGQDDATTDRSQIVRWWTQAPDANVGIATALSDLYVVDIDSHGLHKDGRPKVGAESWATLTEGREVPRTYSVRTQSGSTHLYFRMPMPPLRNSASKLAPDIDTRGNGYVVAPPSVVNGNPYTVLDAAPVAPLPQWIVDALAPKPKVHAATDPADLFAAGARTHAPADEVVGRVRQLADELATCGEGVGNDTAARLAYMAGQYVGAGQLGEDEAISILLDGIAGWTWRADSPASVTENTIVKQVREGMTAPRPWEAARFQDSASTVEVTPVEEEQANPSSDWSTDDGQARAIYRWVGGMLHVEKVGWFLWDGKRWQAVTDVRIRHVVQAYYKSRFDHMVRKYMATMENKWNALADEFKKFMASARLTSIIKAMESINKPVTAQQLDAWPELLNTPAGVVNLRTGEVGPHDPKLLLTKLTAGNYRPGYTHPDWTAALTSLPEDVQPFMQLRMGNAITGYTPESDDCILLQGNGANGKSLMTSDGAMRALGDYAMLASPGLILSQKDSGQATPERASLRGSRFVLIEELPEGRSLSVAELKRIIGTDVLTARFLYGQEFEFHCSHTLFVTTNYLPTVAETDDGTWRRLCLIGFPFKFTGRPEGPMERQGDPGMKHRVRHGAGQHDAIVTWMVEGARAYLADITRIMPEARPLTVVEDTNSWRMQADRIMGYFAERVVVEYGAMIAKNDLYADFTAWLKEGEHHPIGKELFWTRLQTHELWRKLGLTETRKRGSAGISRPVPRQWTGLEQLPSIPRVITGIRFREDADEVADLSVA